MFQDFIIDPKNIHNAKIQTLGAIIQGIYQYNCTKNLDFKYFVLYLILVFASSIMYYKVFLN
jgi:hypothetical protein